MKKLSILFLALWLASMVGAQQLPAGTQKPVDEKRFKDLGHKTMCTCGVCQYVLLECNHVGCQSSTKMISELRTNLQNGANDEAVLDWFRNNYGPTAVLMPKTHGFELTFWVLPPLMGGVGLLLVMLVIWMWRSRAGQQLSPDFAGNPHLDELRARARQETEL